ncbi:competence/damage-inducible protein A [Syntrophomonas palmitatica]|uniref:competence/damage-inducible protein A n=1 Tax=Syntrophomonas palmitatica TaxID=402877 RepID=UPI0006CF7139|nr:competence/damage-inducible protein A [Syntrophomonas palmitatica]
MKKAYIISTGTELLLASTMDTNSVFLSEKLAELGIRVVGKSVVGDNKEMIRKAFETGLDVADLVVSSGGLGPTLDDLTKEVACQVMGCEMILVEEEATRLREYFERRRKPMPESNLKQAMFPPEAVIVKNEMGSAPGMYLNKGGKTIVLLPGPPREMMPMFVKEIGPLLVRDVGPAADRVLMRCIKVIGPGESQVDEMLAEIIKEPRGCSLALLAKEGEVHIKVTAEGENRAGSQKILDEVCCRITDKMGDYVFTDNEEDDLVTVTAKLLLNRNETVAVAESCTGGLLSKMLTDVAGSSRYFWGSVTSYSNEAKELFLGVKKATLEKHGAVSRETAAEMARGIREKAQSTYGIGITGIAGPDGGSADKPVGLVYIALADARNCRVKEMHFAGGRDGVRMLSAKTALDFLRKSISGVK